MRHDQPNNAMLVVTGDVDAKKLDDGQLIGGAEVQGTVPMWNWIGDEGATTFSF